MTKRSGAPDSVSYTVPMTTAVSGGAGATGCCASSRTQRAGSKQQRRREARAGSTVSITRLPAPGSLLVRPFFVIVHAVVIVVLKHSGRPADVLRDGLGVRGVRRVDHGPACILEPARDVHRDREVIGVARQ